MQDQTILLFFAGSSWCHRDKHGQNVSVYASIFPATLANNPTKITIIFFYVRRKRSAQTLLGGRGYGLEAVIHYSCG
ncbi:hypothetical protein SEHO0A_00742 [Salmonella enterica subsp. houtenae str. ATCC BAA-1581]|nr:hypothetical protein SEHO0A_00742 [Salmonella enterica subsp. houtenae str. ATCC BAA-1581]